MDKLSVYALPIRGLKNGVHQFVFEIDAAFFQAFENAEFDAPKIIANVRLDRRESFFELLFEIAGTVGTLCDRCTAPIQLPITSRETLQVKFSEQAVEEDSDIVFISPETSVFNVAQYIFEYIVLAVPIYRVYDCQSQDIKPCDFAALKTLEGLSIDPTEKKITEDKPNAFDALKGFFSEN